MNALKGMLGEIVGLFVDDGSLALAIVSVLVLAGASRLMLPDMPMLTGSILLLGCLGVLAENVRRAARR